MDIEGHLTIDVHMNNVLAVRLVDYGQYGVMEVFMHPDFAKHCDATIRLKTTRERSASLTAELLVPDSSLMK